MTLSLSPSVMKEFFFSLKSFNGVSRKFQGCFDEVLRMFHASFKEKKFEWRFKKVSGVFQGSLKGVLRELCGCFKVISNKYIG